MSAQTKRLYDSRERDFASGREIKKTDREAWNKVLNKATMKDYKQWIQKWVDTMEEADELGNVRAVHEGARALAGKSKGFQATQPTRNKKGDIISSSEELGSLWQEFLAGKFSATELEETRCEYEKLAETNKTKDTLTYKEFEKAVSRMKNNKATGPDGVPEEV